MFENTARKSIPGRDANLPSFIVERMEILGMRPTLTQLALASGVKLVTLQHNIRGDRAMRFSTAIQLAKALEISLDELAANLTYISQ